MPRYVKKYKDKVGRPPGALIHVGKERTGKCRITLFHYDENRFEEKEMDDIRESFPYKDKPGVTWINIDGVHQIDVIEALGAHFQIHPLVLSDIMNTTQRPKMEDFQDFLFIVLKMVYFGSDGSRLSQSGPTGKVGKKGSPSKPQVTGGQGGNGLHFEQVSLIVGTNIVISFQENEGDLFEQVRDRLRGGGGRIRKSGPDYLAYALTDTIVDHYFVILERIGEKIEDVEEVLLTNPTNQTMQAIHAMKRDMVHLRRSIWPLREVTSALEKGESPLIHSSTRIYLRDVYDHTIQVIDTIESSRDILSGMLDIYLSSVSNKMNSVMKVLTIIATIFMPLTFIAGIYGMNFIFMPELGWRMGYPAVLIIMLIIGLAMVVYFRRKKWL